MNFGMIILNQSIKTKQNYPTWILTALLFTLKPNNFLKTLVIMLKNGFDTSSYDEDDKRLLPTDTNKSNWSF